MEKLITVIKDGNHFQVFGELDTMEIEINNASILYNGEEKEIFGETFIGNKIHAIDIANILLRAYLNGDKSIEFTYVHNEIEQIKQECQVYISAKPQRYFCADGDIAQLIAYTEDNSYYMSDNNFIVTYSDNSLATNYEHLFMNAIIEDYNANKLILVSSVEYNSDDIEEWLKA